MELIVGRIVKSHGIRGEVVVDVRTDSPEERFAPGSQLTVALARKTFSSSTLPSELTVTTARVHSGRMLVRFAEVNNRDTADTLRGAHLVVDSDDLAPLDADDEFYDHELIGLNVLLQPRDEAGQPISDSTDLADIGTVTEIMHTPAGEILAIATTDAVVIEGKELLVPFIEQFVPHIDIEAGTVTVCPPAGLIALGNSAD